MHEQGEARVYPARKRALSDPHFSLQEDRLRIVEGSWDEVDLGPHDALISALDKHLEGLGMDGEQKKKKRGNPRGFDVASYSKAMLKVF